jgi:hypothetical protein
VFGYVSISLFCQFLHEWVCRREEKLNFVPDLLPFNMLPCAIASLEKSIFELRLVQL